MHSFKNLKVIYTPSLMMSLILISDFFIIMDYHIIFVYSLFLLMSLLIVLIFSKNQYKMSMDIYLYMLMYLFWSMPSVNLYLYFSCYMNYFMCFL